MGSEMIIKEAIRQLTGLKANHVELVIMDAEGNHWSPTRAVWTVIERDGVKTNVVELR
jgi:hypothetical protein